MDILTRRWLVCSKKRRSGRCIEHVSFSAGRHQQQRDVNATNLSVYIDELGRREEQSSFYSTHLGISVRPRALFLTIDRWTNLLL